MKKQFKPRGPYNPIREEERQKIKELDSQGMKQYSIAKAIGRSPYTVCIVLKAKENDDMFCIDSYAKDLHTI